MKARIQRTDASILLIHTYPDQIACASNRARAKAQLLAHSDATARIARIKMLKEQVDAGRYIIDSRAIAQKMHLWHLRG